MESAMQRRRSTISADWKKKRGESIDAAPADIRLTSAGWRVKATTSSSRAWASAPSRSCRTWVAPPALEADAVARGPGRGAGRAEESGVNAREATSASCASPHSMAESSRRANTKTAFHLGRVLSVKVRVEYGGCRSGSRSAATRYVTDSATG